MFGHYILTWAMKNTVYPYPYLITQPGQRTYINELENPPVL